MSLEELLNLLADTADGISMQGFARDPDTRTKADGTIVTEFDSAVEERLRAEIAARFPEDRIYGEEMGGEPDDRVSWIIDPIDGTINYASGVPVWATLIAHLTDGKVDAAIVSAPALGSRWTATKDGGARHNGRAIHVSDTTSLSDAAICYGTWSIFNEARRTVMVSLLQRCRHSRGFGDFWGHMLVASGSLDAMIDPAVALWDVAAASLIVTEAGGVFSRIDGSEGLGGDAISATPGLHPLLVAEFEGTDT